MRNLIQRAALAPLLLAASVSTHAATWVMDPEDSKVEFTYTFTGDPYTGVFHNVEAVFEINPLSPANCRFEVTIPIADIDVGDEETLSYLHDWDLFDVDQFPYARFVAERCSLTSVNSFNADGQLTIRDQTHPISFPFKLEVERDLRFRLTSEVTIRRLDFDVGLGYWAGTGEIANDVVVSVDVYATRQ
jgi:polyisoprenoid-binding protein YceI